MGAKLKSRLQSEERNVLDPFFSTLELVFWAISSSLPWPTVPTGSLISKQIGIIYIYIKLNIQYIYIYVCIIGETIAKTSQDLTESIHHLMALQPTKGVFLSPYAV